MQVKSNKYVVQLKNVSKSFGKVQALRNISFEVSEGEILSLIGPSGCGKSTCLRCINALETIDSGEMRIDGMKVNYKDERQKREIRQKVGIVFQSFNLFPHLTVEGNIMLGLIKVQKMPKNKAKEVANYWLKSIGVEEKARNTPDELSGGQQQRVAIARALAIKPRILLLDEITSALDPELTQEVLELITELAEQRMTMIVVSHELGFVRKLANSIAFLENGKIAAQGSTEQMFNSDDKRLRDFLRRIISE